MSMNLVLLVGAVTSEVKEIADGKLRSFSMTTWNVNSKNGQRYDTRHSIDLLRNAKVPSLHIGQMITVRGTLNRRSYEKNGEKRWITSIMAWEITEIDYKNVSASVQSSVPAPPAATYPPAVEDEEPTTNVEEYTPDPQLGF